MNPQRQHARDVYITAAGAYLPGAPVDNDHIESVLGLIDGKPSRLKKRILKSNGILARHYALDECGQTTELNEELAAKAARAALAASVPWRAGEISSLLPLERSAAEIAAAASRSPLAARRTCRPGRGPHPTRARRRLEHRLADFERMLRATAIVRRIEAGQVGSEALSAFMFHRASQPDPIDLVGAMFVIEGLGTHKALQWAEALQRQLHLTGEQVSFLRYHGHNDDHHFNRLREVLTSGIVDDGAVRRIVKTAKVVARLYALQLEELDNA